MSKRTRPFTPTTISSPRYTMGASRPLPPRGAIVSRKASMRGFATASATTSVTTRAPGGGARLAPLHVEDGAGRGPGLLSQLAQRQPRLLARPPELLRGLAERDVMAVRNRLLRPCAHAHRPSLSRVRAALSIGMDVADSERRRGSSTTSCGGGSRGSIRAAAAERVAPFASPVRPGVDPLRLNRLLRLLDALEVERASEPRRR